MIAHSVYIHWPFCLSKCPYCDFNSHISKDIDYDLWHEAYKTEIEFYKNNYPIGKVKTIFFGGGTPSLMPPYLVENIINILEQTFGFKDNIEISLEANPTSSESKKFKDYYNSGINRLSMGIQALNDKDLKFLGRTHSAQEAIEAFEKAKSIFENVSFDMIFARQNQTIDQWEKELQKVVNLAVDHISLYGLTIEDGTIFSGWYKRGKINIPDDDEYVQLYELTNNILTSKGYEHYEISNFAKNDKYCQHNLNYWRYQPYIGIGPGSHGRVYSSNNKIFATQTLKSPKEYLNNPLNIKTDKLSPKGIKLEYVLMGLRLNEGINLNKYDMSFDWNKVKLYEENGFLNYNNYTLSLTQKGRMIMDSILSDIL